MAYQRTLARSIWVLVTIRLKTRFRLQAVPKFLGVYWGVSGGVTIDLATGEIVGGSVGGEALGFGINASSSKDGGLGVEVTVQLGPIEISLGFGFPPKGKEPTPTPTPTPTPDNKMPSNWEPTIPSAPSFSVEAGEMYYVKKTTVSVDSKYYYDDGNGFTIYTVTPPQTGKLKSPIISPPSEPGFCQSPTQRQVEAMLTTPGRISMLPAGLDAAYYAASLINRMQINSATTYLAPFGIISSVQQTYYRKCITLDHPGFENPGYPRTYWFCPTIGGREFSLMSAAIYNPYNTLPNKAEGYNWRFLEWELISRTTFELVKCKKLLSPSLSPPPFPNPPPRKRNKMNDCCSENLNFLRAIYKGLGIAKFPGQLPSTIIQQVPKEGEQPAEPPQVPIGDFVDLLDWQFRRDDERWGQWEIQIDIKDSDITKEGDQKKSVKFPNLAESVAELEGQILSIMTNVDALVALQVKNLAESGMARQEAIKGYLASKAIIKYMAFKSSEIDVPVPMTFTAVAETISELLKESEGHIKGTDYAEKETLRDVYLDLLQAAAIIRAVHWQKIDTKTDTKSQLLNILKGSVDLASSIAKPQKPNGEGEGKAFDPEKNFEDFIDSVEDGFRNTTGITDVQNPYGKSPDRRPRIRQIGDNISQAGGGD